MKLALSGAVFRYATCIGYLMLVIVGCIPEAEPANSAAVLGEHLFFDPVLSRDSSISCASCHKPEFAFADSLKFSKGVAGRLQSRNTPGILNQADRNAYFWDGRAETLEDQVFGPMESHSEMDFPVSLSVKRLKRSPFYNRSFRRIFGKSPSPDLIAIAIAEFEKSLISGVTPFDKYVNNDDTISMSASARRGLEIFNGKGRCFDCHFGVDFTGGDQFKSIGLYNGKNLNDPGRSAITNNAHDLGAFKIPGLRNVAYTAPYMHNGMFATLKEVIEYYNNPDSFVPDAINRDTVLSRPLNLNAREKEDLLKFLQSLSDENKFKSLKTSH